MCIQVGSTPTMIGIEVVLLFASLLVINQLSGPTGRAAEGVDDEGTHLRHRRVCVSAGVP